MVASVANEYLARPALAGRVARVRAALARSIPGSLNAFVEFEQNDANLRANLAI